MLNPLQKQRYGEDGYLVLPGFKASHEIDALRRRAMQIVDAFDPQAGSDVLAPAGASRLNFAERSEPSPKRPTAVFKA